MIKHILTLTDYLLQEEQTAANAPGGLAQLLSIIEQAARVIADQLSTIGLVNLLGKTDRVNSFGEEVQKLDAFANQLLVDTLLDSGTVYAVASEEMEQPVFTPLAHGGEYIVYIDPIDGSSNIDVNGPIGTIFYINEAYEALYDERTRAYLAHLRASADYTARYVGSLVADIHRTMPKGGIFLYPANRKQPEGKLRLMLEVNPFALLIEHAGGKAMSGNGKSPLTITPKTVHDRASLFIGSKENVDLYAGFLSAR